MSSAFCIPSQGCFPYLNLISAVPAALACGPISFSKIQSLKATQHPPKNHLFPGSLARNSPRIWSGFVFAGCTPHHWRCVATRQPHALNRTANISDNGLAAEEIAPLPHGNCTTFREGLPVQNQSHGTSKGRQILIHYETAQPRKAELLFSGMLSGQVTNAGFWRVLFTTSEHCCHATLSKPLSLKGRLSLIKTSQSRI